jgi:hypothetical protein
MRVVASGDRCRGASGGAARDSLKGDDRDLCSAQIVGSSVEIVSSGAISGKPRGSSDI